MMHGDTGAIYLVDRHLYPKGNTAGKNGRAKGHRGLDIQWVLDSNSQFLFIQKNKINKK